MFVERDSLCESPRLDHSASVLAEISPVLTFKELGKQFLATMSDEISLRTIKAYGSDFKDFSEYLDRHGLNKGGMSVLSSVQGYIYDLTERKFSQATVKRRLSFLSVWAQWGLDKGYLEDRVVLDEINRERHKVQKGELPHQENEITGEVIAQLFEAAKNDPRDLAMFRIAYS